MKIDLEESWARALDDALKSDSFAELSRFVDGERKTREVYPSEDRVFSAFRLTPFDRVKVVLLGQDPYHEPGQAQGLAFYVPPDVKTPPSLRNIAKELADEFPGTDPGFRPDLVFWAEQGVLLLNATLTVAAHEAGSHQKHGWETFTDAAIRALSENRDHLVFLLWGAHAQRKKALVDETRHLVLEAAHPSPLSARRGFFGCGHFRACNDALVRWGQTPVDWLGRSRAI